MPKTTYVQIGFSRADLKRVDMARQRDNLELSRAAFCRFAVRETLDRIERENAESVAVGATSCEGPTDHTTNAKGA